MSNALVFLVNHHHGPACGVYQHGNRVARICAHSEKHRFLNIEANHISELYEAIAAHGKPDVIVYNYHPIPLGWSAYAHLSLPGIIHVGTVHEGCHEHAAAGNTNILTDQFPFWIWHDPSIQYVKSKAENLFHTVRPLPFRVNPLDIRDCQVHHGKNYIVGTFGFPLAGKGYEDVVLYCKDRGVSLRMHLPDALFGQGTTQESRANIERYCQEQGVDAEISSGFLDEQSLLEWLAANDENALFYHHNYGRGISSASDFGVAAGRPLTLSDSDQFRHIHTHFGYWYPDHPAPRFRTYPVEPLMKAWHPSEFLRDMDTIIDKLGAIGS